MPGTPDGRAVHEAVARAAGLRQRAARHRRAWRAAPILAALFLLVAVAGRLAGWPAYAPLAAGAALALVLAAYTLLPRRSDDVSDAEATALDDRASLGGELRSAHWFASHDTDSAWIRHHLARAIDRIRATAWPDLYAPERAPRAYAATAILGIAAIIVTLLGPVTRAFVPGLQEDRAAGAVDRPLTAIEIERELAALLADLETGESRGGRTVTAEDVRKLLERVRESQRKNAGRQGVPLDEKLRERLERASQMDSLDADMRNALEDLKKALPAPNQLNAEKADLPRDAAGKTDAPPDGKKGGEPSGKSDSKADPSAQVTSDAQPGSGIGIVAMTNDPAGAPSQPGLGQGGGDGGSPNSGVMVDLGAALRRETLETGAGESAGDPATDLRHKTDRGTASVGFSHAAAAAAVRGRATTVPIVPEARRPAARAYFHRKK